MNNQDNDSVDSLRIHIVSFGDEGNTAAQQLAESPLMQPLASKHGSCKFTRLTPHKTSDDIETIIENAHMVIILGCDYYTDIISQLQYLIKVSHENKILCYVVLSVNNASNVANELAILCKQASNTLLIPFDKTIGNLQACDLMREAVLNITDTLLGKGMIAVDLDDIKTVMQSGNVVYFGIGIATGNQRAKDAITDAFNHIPNIEKARAIICNIEADNNFNMEEFNEIFEHIESIVSDNCITAIGTTFNPSIDSMIARVTAL